MICKACNNSKHPEAFGQWAPGRKRTTCNTCRSAMEKRRVTDARREKFRLLTNWPAPQ